MGIIKNTLIAICASTICACQNPGSFPEALTAKFANGKQEVDALVKQINDLPPPIIDALPSKLTRKSFGRMSKQRDFITYRCEYILTPDGQRCDLGEAVNRGFGLDSWINRSSLEPEFLKKYDPTLVHLELQQHFPNAGGQDESRVRVFNSTAEGIDFLYIMPYSDISQGEAAASDYCEQFDKKANFVGISVACVKPTPEQRQRDMAARKVANKIVSGTDKTYPWLTYAIVSFDCSTTKKDSSKKKSLKK